MRWLDGITESTDMSWSKFQGIVKDRKPGVLQSHAWAPQAQSPGVTPSLLVGLPRTPVVVSENKLNQKRFGGVGPCMSLLSPPPRVHLLPTLQLSFPELAPQECLDGRRGIVKYLGPLRYHLLALALGLSVWSIVGVRGEAPSSWPSSIPASKAVRPIKHKPSG